MDSLIIHVLYRIPLDKSSSIAAIELMGAETEDSAVEWFFKIGPADG